ncbi:MAG: glycosyltransferase family 4 protein [Bacteroidetes bacterium]|nr:glycosyltransferase family 4 protein [Bacteroidota bacterium]
MSTFEVPPKLLIVGPLPPPYIGPAIATERLVASPVLAERFQLRLVNTSDPGGEHDIGRLTPHNVGEAIGQVWRFIGALIGWRPRVVYMSIARGFWGFLRDVNLILLARLFGVRVLIHLRAGRFDLIHDSGAMGRLLARVGLGSVTYALVLGETTRDIFGPYVPQDRVKVVPNGMDLDAWPAPQRRPRPGFNIVYLANIFRDKGTHVMLAALPAIARQVPDVMVHFAGEWHDLAYRDLCLKIVAEHHLEEHVKFHGVVNGNPKRELLDVAHVLAFVPVAPEGSPWVVLEAMACGLPVVGTPQGTMREVIVDGETGFLIPSGDPDALADRMIRLARDRQLCCTMGAAGRARIEQVYAENRTHAVLADIVASAAAR